MRRPDSRPTALFAGPMCGLVLALALAGCASSPPPAAAPVNEQPTVPPSTVGTPTPSGSAGSVTLQRDGLERQLRKATVRIRNTSCGGLTTGSGFLLEPGVVVTNRHVVAGAIVLELSTWDGRSVEAPIHAVAFDADLAIVRLADALDGYETVQFGTPVPDTPVAAVGYPAGGPFEISTGRVLGTVDGKVFGQDGDVLRFTAPVIPGNSGGPLMNREGRVVGVVFGYELDSRIGLAIPARELENRLAAQGFGVPPPRC